MESRKRQHGWPAAIRRYVYQRKLRRACRYIGCVEDSRDPANWVAGRVPHDGDSVNHQAPKGTHPLRLQGIRLDTLWHYGGGDVYVDRTAAIRQMWVGGGNTTFEPRAECSAVLGSLNVDMRR